MSESDTVHLTNFLHTSKDAMTESGLHLYKSANVGNYNNLTRNLSISKVPSTDKFLIDFCYLYESNPIMNDNLLVYLIKRIVCKMTGEINPKYPVNALNFFTAMHSSGNKQLF